MPRNVPLAWVMVCDIFVVTERPSSILFTDMASVNFGSPTSDKSSSIRAHAPVIHANNVNNKNIRAEAKRAIFIYKVFKLQSYKKNRKDVPPNALQACFSKILYIILYVKNLALCK